MPSDLIRGWVPVRVTKTRQINPLFLAAGKLFLQRRELCERRIGIGRTIAVAWRGAGGPLPVRRAAVALVAATLVAPAEIAATFVAPAAVALVAIAALVAVAAKFFTA